MIPHPSYTLEEKALVDDLVCAAAGFLLGRGRHVVIDGMALSSAARVDELVRIATSRNVPAKIIECVCVQETALARISGDGGSHPAGDRSRDLYFEVKARFQHVPHPALTVDTDREDDANLSAILAHLAD
jgi:predicted kinase